MKKFLLLPLASLIMNLSYSQPGWQLLFDGKDLTGWETYLGPRYSPEKGDFDGEPVGLNRDPREVFTVVQLDDGPAIRISGAEFGGISTLDSFSNYHLQLQFKWGTEKHAPRTNEKRDSGLLYHANGPHGADWFFWMSSQEFQIQEGDCGDYWGLGSDVTVKVKMQADSTFAYHPNGQSTAFGAHSKIRNAKKKPDGMEKPWGEWNTIDLYTFGSTSIHMVNGTVVMILEDSRQPVDEKVLPLTRGKIQIQSEGAEIYYRNIRIEPITELPKEWMD